MKTTIRIEVGDEPALIADAMLEKLARWIRLLGFDCAFESGIGDERLIRRAIDEGRIVLTRDLSLAEEWRVEPIVEVPAGSLETQLDSVVRRLDLAERMRPLSRCSRCNVVVEYVGREDVKGRVPNRIHSIYERFSRCPKCDAIHWEGAHVERIRRVIDSVRSDQNFRGS
ncbi:MAG: Mut7-C RNAse domain-containing protein [Thermoanaerobaculia bacterium]|nr:Mut7-C RNAse domain-containing protein [Thermoanaerobaculia bacterium]